MTLLRLLIIPVLALSLSGCVGVLVAGAAATVSVVTDPRSTEELFTDRDISLQVNALGNKQPFANNVRVTATTFRGNTLLMGQAVTQQYKEQVEAKVRDIKGVKAVYNQLKVKPLLSLSEVSQDTWITTKVKSALLAETELARVKISVYTEDKEVFLVGAVTKEHADLAVEVARNISGVSKVMRAFYYGDQLTEQVTAAVETEDITNQAPSTTTQTEEAQVEEIPFIPPVEVN